MILNGTLTKVTRFRINNLAYLTFLQCWKPVDPVVGGPSLIKQRQNMNNGEFHPLFLSVCVTGKAL